MVLDVSPVKVEIIPMLNIILEKISDGKKVARMISKLFYFILDK